MPNRFKQPMSEEAKARLSPEEIEPLEKKSRAASNFKKGAAYEGGYAAYRAILLARKGDSSFSLRDDVECFVDDMVIEAQGEPPEYCQAKSGEVKWRQIVSDVIFQRAVDAGNLTPSIYTVVVSEAEFRLANIKTRNDGFRLERFGR